MGRCCFFFGYKVCFFRFHSWYNTTVTLMSHFDLPLADLSSDSLFLRDCSCICWRNNRLQLHLLDEKESLNVGDSSDPFEKKILGDSCLVLCLLCFLGGLVGFFISFTLPGQYYYTPSQQRMYILLSDSDFVNQMNILTKLTILMCERHRCLVHYIILNNRCYYFLR